MRWPPRRILVGTDFSPSATAAARAAAALARRAGASLELAHVLSSAPPFLVGYEPLDVLLLRREDVASARARAKALLEELARELAPESCHLHLPEGPSAAVELLALRERLEADLVALGSIGQRGLRRFLLGSVADRVLRHPGHPLLLVREAPPSGELKRVVIAHELPNRSTPWLELGMRLAHDERSEVVLVHVLPPRGYASDAHHVDLDTEHTPARLAGLVARVAPKIPTQIDVRQGDPAHEIPAAAREHGAHLVVMGAERNARGWPGRVADRVAREGLPAVLFVWPESESDEEFE
jgi:nucleotide-binding universal stress UspA family protein